MSPEEGTHSHDERRKAEASGPRGFGTQMCDARNEARFEVVEHELQCTRQYMMAALCIALLSAGMMLGARSDRGRRALFLTQSQ